MPAALAPTHLEWTGLESQSTSAERDNPMKLSRSRKSIGDTDRSGFSSLDLLSVMFITSSIAQATVLRARWISRKHHFKDTEACSLDVCDFLP